MAESFGQRLRRIREGRSVSQEWVHVRARELGYPKPVSTACIKKLERDVHQPSVLTLVQLRAIFFELPRT
jgi:transcriptional regulator with XRE-family HTH domain